MGHSLRILPHPTQAAICPHSRKTHSIGASMQILHRSSVGSFSDAKMKAEKLHNLKQSVATQNLRGAERWSCHNLPTRSFSSCFSQHPLKSTRFSIKISFSCLTDSDSRSWLELNKHKNVRIAWFEHLSESQSYLEWMSLSEMNLRGVLDDASPSESWSSVG